MSFDEIAKRMGFSAGYLATTYNKRKQKNEEQGFYACNRWCNGCKYYGKLLATPCCWYTYYTGKAKDEPAKGCSYKEYGESLEIAERRRT